VTELTITVESAPKPEEIRVLDDGLYEFNVATTGHTDGGLFGVFLREPHGTVVGGANGWIWGGTCHVQFLFVPAQLRGLGHGSRLMAAVETEARTRGCVRIILETYDYQAPEFYRRLGFAAAAAIEEYVQGHRLFVLVKRLDDPPPPVDKLGRSPTP
jgi:GNAT superfamily N-acetyltransferase